MKYIRTKDNRIIEFTPKQKYENDKTTFDWFVANYCGGGINVSKVADTIDELCDCFSYDTETTKDYSVARGWKLSNKEREIFGCIKTDKGLIYVAKMNSEGVLELL